MNEDALQALNQTLNQIMEKELGYFQPSYRYYSDRRTKDMYFWTTEKMNRNGKARFVSGIYRYHKTKRQWKALDTSLAGHAKRKDAKARALKLYQA